MRRRRLEPKDTSGAKPWLQFYDEGVPANIDYPQVPLDRLLAGSAAKHPEHPAILFGAVLGSRAKDKAKSAMGKVPRRELASA